MRLIDADALGIGKCNPDVFENKAYADGWNAAVGMIKNAPTVETESAKYGHWIFGETYGHSWMKCSECLKVQGEQTACFTYCPNCGAKMMNESEIEE